MSIYNLPLLLSPACQTMLQYLLHIIKLSFKLCPLKLNGFSLGTWTVKYIIGKGIQDFIVIIRKQ